MQKIVPFLWFNGQAEEATSFYVSVFANSKIISIKHYKGDLLPDLEAFTTTFELAGQVFMALDFSRFAFCSCDQPINFSRCLLFKTAEPHPIRATHCPSNKATYLRVLPVRL